MNVKKYILIYENMGWRYFMFRISYEIQRKSGLLRRKFPVSYEEHYYVTLNEWRDKSLPFFFSSKNDLAYKYDISPSLKDDFYRILKGEYCYFSLSWFALGFNYDWVTNPETGYKYDCKHWIEIEDIVEKVGDIKYVWEKSRFSFLYSVIRYDHAQGEDHSSFVFDQILDWIDKNPLNCGPNYKCSQEISLRALNWIFALYYYKISPNLTSEIFQRIINSIYWQIKHVYSNIDFSRIAVRNNHAITETLTLYLVGLLFPWFPEAKKWKAKGKKWFEQEIEYQIAEDGTYLQFSMNYHRVVVQLLTWAISIADNNGETFSDIVYQRAYYSVNFLYQCQEPVNGYLPNYGSNDGALFFKLSDNNYRDYRPQLDALHYILTGENLYDEVYEDREWYTCSWNTERKKYSPIKRQFGCVTFEKGGYYLIREKETLTFIRCGRYKDRPAHADNLHVDIWYKGENILMDGGSYKYNTDFETIKYFMGTRSHNSVMLGNNDQMQKGERFIWFYWSQALDGSLTEEDDYFCFVGKVHGFRQLESNIVHERKIVKRKDKPEWFVQDTVNGKPSHLNLHQYWHTDSAKVDIKSEGLKSILAKGWQSEYYGEKRENKEIEFITNSQFINTHIQVF